MPYCNLLRLSSNASPEFLAIQTIDDSFELWSASLSSRGNKQELEGPERPVIHGIGALGHLLAAENE